MGESGAAIEKFIVEELVADPAVTSLPHDEDLLAADLIDSMGIQQLVTFLESSFGIAVADEDLVPENFRSVESIADFVARKG